MGRTRAKPIPLEQRTRIVLSVLAGEMTMAEAARRNGVSRETVAKWRDRFVAGGRDALQDKLSGPSSVSMTTGVPFRWGIVTGTIWSLNAPLFMASTARCWLCRAN